MGAEIVVCVKEGCSDGKQKDFCACITMARDIFNTLDKPSGEFKIIKNKKAFNIQYFFETDVFAGYDVAIYKFIETNLETGETKDKWSMTTSLTMKPSTVYKISRERWDIENNCFKYSKDYYNMEHCFVHNKNAIKVIFYIMFAVQNTRNLFLLEWKSRIPDFKKMPDIHIFKAIVTEITFIPVSYIFDTS